MVSWLPLPELLDDDRVAGLDPLRVERTFDAVENRIEGYHERAWVPRETVEQRRGRSSRSLFLERSPARELVEVLIGGEPADLEGFVLWSSGRLERNVRFPRGAQVQVTYMHGEDEPPSDLLDAAVRATATLVTHSTNPRVGERTDTVVSEGMTINFAALPDVSRDRPFGMPDVDTVVNLHRRPKARVG